MSTEIIKTRREFVKNTDVSVAAGATEAIFDEAFKGSVREFVIQLDFNNDSDAAEESSLITITIDDVEVVNLSPLDLYRCFAGNSVGLEGSVVSFVEYDFVTEKKCSLRIELQTLVETGVKVEIKNGDSVNAAYAFAGLVYDH